MKLSQSQSQVADTAYELTMALIKAHMLISQRRVGLNSTFLLCPSLCTQLLISDGLF